VEQAFRPAFKNHTRAASAAEVHHDNPVSRNTGSGTYFITASCWEKQRLLQSDRMAKLLMDLLFHYQGQKKYQLHEFVVMPDHFHALLTPLPPVTLERAIQFIKGGFSFRSKRELGLQGEVWQTSFYDHRVRDTNEYSRFRHYIHMNPVRRGLVPRPEEFPYSSAILELDEAPQWLKPAA
jgi:putative transposase